MLLVLVALEPAEPQAAEKARLEQLPAARRVAPQQAGQTQAGLPVLA